MSRNLITGMSGTGKSAVVDALVARGHRAVDVDADLITPIGDGRRLWDVEKVGAVLDEPVEVVYLAGCEENMGQLFPRLDSIILLTAPLDVIRARLAARTTNPFGKDPAELERVLVDVRTIEPLLRRVATHVVDATRPLDEVVEEVERIGSGER